LKEGWEDQIIQPLSRLSSMSTGRYQSRVFNFLSQQSLRLRDRSAQTWRQVKVAAVWGVQILLYPVYVGFQGTRLVERQLQRTARRTIPRLRSAGRALQQGKPLSDSVLLPVDAPLQNVLEAANKATLTDTTLHIRAIASRRDTGSLVLVTSQNQLLDLNFEQQTQLTRRIAWENANYWRQRRLLNPPQPVSLVSTFLPPVKPRPNALLPIRVLQKVMAWMQRGSVAVSADLFQESRLVVYLPAQPALPDAGDAPLRSAQPSWVAMEVQFYDWLEQAGQATTDLLLAGLKSGRVAFSDIVRQFVERRTESPLPTADPLKSFQLPAASDWLPLLDRWLSQVPGLDQPQLPASAPQPWLTMEDLFDQPEPSLTANLEMAHTEVAQPDDGLSQPPHLSFKGWVKRSLNSILPARQTTPIEHPAVWETTDTAALETAIKISQIKFPQPRSSRASQTNLVRSQRSSMTQAQAYPSAFTEFHADQRLTTPRLINPLDQVAPLSSMDTANQEEAAMLPQSWIETDAKLVEYVKHPLTQLLEWLDKSMLWLETRLAKLWHWLTRPIE
jgi:hypothetical protein